MTPSALVDKMTPSHESVFSLKLNIFMIPPAQKKQQ